MPNWLMEGGAVIMECVMSFHTNGSYEHCFRQLGGRGGILPNVIKLYSGNDTQWLGKYGSDRTCGDYVPQTMDISLTDDQEG